MNNKTVVFISGSPRGREYKLAAGLQQLGWSVVLLWGGTPLFSDFKYFSKSISITSYSAEQLLSLINEIAPDMCHIFTYYEYEIPALLLGSERSYPIILDPYDLVSGMFTKDFYINNPGYQVQMNWEQDCLLKADGICCRHLETQVFTRKSLPRKQLRALILDSCMPVSVTKSEITKVSDIHIVYAGQVSVEKQQPEHNEGLLWIARKIVECGLNFHVYPSVVAGNDFDDIFSEYRELEKTSGGRFQLHQPIAFENLTKELAKYDVGILGMSSKRHEIAHERTNYKMNYAISNKVFDYLDAGLPIITNDAAKFMTFCIKKHGAAILPDQLLFAGRPSFDLEMFYRARAGVLTAQKQYHFLEQAKRLAAFYCKIISSKHGVLTRNVEKYCVGALDRTCSSTETTTDIEKNQAARISHFEAILQQKYQLADEIAAKPNTCSADMSYAGTQYSSCQEKTKEHVAEVTASSGKDQHYCCFLNTYYSAFLDCHYKKHPGLAEKSYYEQKQSLYRECFGDSDFYSQKLIQAGWLAEDIILNCKELQTSWARENGFDGGGLDVMIEQIQRLSPDVVYTQDFNFCTKAFFELVRPHARLIVGQIASPVPELTQLEAFDIIISSFPHFVEKFRQAGITAYYQPLAFEPRVLNNMPNYHYDLRPIDCSFVGGLSTLHSKAYGLMEFLAGTTAIQFWGYGAATLPADSPILAKHHGEVWGNEMFRVLASSKITINRHIDVAENYANNMRLFEATGCGALLITDYKDNLNDLFEIGKEVVAYRSAEECAALVTYYLAHPDEAKVIAAAGQARTLKDHTYALRMEQTAEILARHLRYKREHWSLPLNEDIQSGLQLISREEVTKNMEKAWQCPEIACSQRALVQHELAEMYRGVTHNGYMATPFKVLADILKPIVRNGDSILEIGCASGYYYEILEYLLNVRLDYTGVDYSEAMIAMAKDYYPKVRYFASDGRSLLFDDRQFAVVISSCILLHVPNYREHIYETARVADHYIVVSRTPVCKLRPTQYLKKYAYGVETVELIFNEEELIREFAVNRFTLVEYTEFYSVPSEDIYHITYLFRRD